MMPVSICPRRACRTQVEGEVALCPHCGQRMTTPSVIRRSGWVMAVIGGAITLPMAFVTFKFLPVVLDPAGAVAAGRFGGAAAHVPLAFALLLLVLAFGLANLLFGWQRARSGRRNPIAKPVTLLLGVAMLGGMLLLGKQLPDAPLVSSSAQR